MDPKLMNAWLAAQSQKKQITEADIQRKRLGIAEDNNQELPFSLRRRGIREDTGWIPFVDDPVLQKALDDKGVIVKKPNPTRAELEALAGIDRSNFSALGPFDRDRDLLKMDKDSQPSRPSPAPQPQVNSNKRKHQLNQQLPPGNWEKVNEDTFSQAQVWITDGVIKDPITGKMTNKNKRLATPEEVHALGFDNPNRPGGPQSMMNQALRGTQAAIDRGGPGFSPTGRLKLPSLPWPEPLRFP